MGRKAPFCVRTGGFSTVSRELVEKTVPFRSISWYNETVLVSLLWADGSKRPDRARKGSQKKPCRKRPLQPLQQHRAQAALPSCGSPVRRAIPWQPGCSARPTPQKRWKDAKGYTAMYGTFREGTKPLMRAWPCFSARPTAIPARTWWSFPAMAAMRRGPPSGGSLSCCRCAACRARRVHPPRVPERQAGSDAGRSGHGS